GRADRLRHGGEKPGLVDARDLDAHRARRALPVLPLHVDAPLRVALEHLRTVERVHRHAAPARDEAGDALAGQRAAALPEAHQHVLHARDLDAALRLPADHPEQALEAALAPLAPALELFGREELAEHLLRRQLPVADAREQRVLVLLPELVGHAAQRAVAAQPRQVELVAAEVALQDLAPHRHRAARLLRLHPGADAPLRARRLHQLEPVLRRLLVGGADDLDRVAALQLVAQRHDLPVDARPG